MIETAKTLMGGGKAFVVAAFVAATAIADTAWDNPAGGNIADGGNWTNGVPSSGTASVAPPLSGSLTLSEDFSSGSAQWFFNGTGNITLDLGAERTLTCPYRVFVRPGAVATLASGTWKMTGDRFFVGDNASDATFIVDGAGSALYGHTSGNYYIEVGSANGVNSRNNLLLVRNGGLVNGGVVIGRLANGDAREFCGTNTFRVTGQGSRFVSQIYQLEIGCQQGMSHAIFDDHAAATLSNAQSVRMGVRYTDNNRSLAGDQNLLRVATGASLDASGAIYVGFTSASNTFEVLDGATATAETFSTSYEKNANVKNGRAPFGNRVVVSGEDARLTVTGESYLGHVDGSHGDSMLIANGGVFVNTGVPLDIGYKGWGCSVCLTNGGSWNPDNFVYLGTYSRSNTLEVAEGSEMILGNQLRHSFYLPSDGMPSGWNKVLVHGKGAKLRVASNSPVRVARFSDSLCDEMRVEDGGMIVQESVFQSPYNAVIDNDPSKWTRGGTSSNFVLSVVGEGSVYDFQSSNFELSYNENDISTNMFNRIYVAGGGALVMTAGNAVCNIANGKTVKTAYCADNMFHIGPGGRFLHVVAATNSGSCNFRLGNNASACRNTVRVEGLFAYTNTMASYTTNTCNVRIGGSGSSNLLEVVNGGEMTVNGAQFIVGNSAEGAWNSAYVGSNSVLHIANAEVAHIGLGGSCSRLTVDGGVFDATDAMRVCFGTLISASNATFEVLNGATATVTRLVFADKAPGCTAVISNATLNIVSHKDANGYDIPSAGFMDLAYSVAGSGSDPSGARFTIAGRDGKVRVDGGLRIRNASAKLVFQVPAEGFAETPLVVGDVAEVASGASIVVEAEEDWPYGSSQTLVERANGQAFGSAADDLTLVCADDRLRVRRASGRIYVSKPNGTALIFR